MRRPLPFLLPVLLAASALLAAGTSRADPPPPTPLPRTPTPSSSAATQGGAGQQPLHFAEDDAQRMAQRPPRARSLRPGRRARAPASRRPRRSSARSTTSPARSAADAARGEQTEVVFYYSGHARATAINLGGDELPLTTLRERLSALPATLTIVVLDACQSGAFARVKGAEPAADFTYNSVSRLHAEGPRRHGVEHPAGAEPGVGRAAEARTSRTTS